MRLLTRFAAVLAEAFFVLAVKVAVELDVGATGERLLAALVVLTSYARVVVAVRTSCEHIEQVKLGVYYSAL